jgi:hypothetical protein
VHDARFDTLVYLPFEQDAQPGVVGSDLEPAGHTTHSVFPAFAWSPVTQFVQTEAPPVDMLSPAQVAHGSTLLLLALNVPASQ